VSATPPRDNHPSRVVVFITTWTPLPCRYSSMNEASMSYDGLPTCYQASRQRAETLRPQRHQLGGITSDQQVCGCLAHAAEQCWAA